MLEAGERLVDEARDLLVVRQLAAIGSDDLAQGDGCGDGGREGDGGWEGDFVVAVDVVLGGGQRLDLAMSVRSWTAVVEVPAMWARAAARRGDGCPWQARAEA